MGGLNKLVHVQRERKKGCEGIRANNNIGSTHDRRAFDDAGERDEHVDDGPRLKIRVAVADHHRGSIDVPLLDRSALSTAGCQDGRSVEAGVGAVRIERDVDGGDVIGGDPDGAGRRENGREQTTGDDANIDAGRLQRRNGLSRVGNETNRTRGSRSASCSLPVTAPASPFLPWNPNRVAMIIGRPRSRARAAQSAF